MSNTLYDRLVEAQSDFALAEENNIKIGDTRDYERNIIDGYENNPFISQALENGRLIEETLRKLAKVNKGFRRFIPHRRKTYPEWHNDIVHKMGELVDEPFYLRRNGVFALDNFVNGAILAGVTAKYVAPFLIKLLPDVPEMDPTLINILTGIMAPFMGIAVNSPRFLRPAYKQARQLDEKIKELYG